MITAIVNISMMVVCAPRQPLTDDLEKLKGEWKIAASAWHSKLEPFAGKHHIEIDAKRITFFGNGGRKWSLKILEVEDGKIDFKKEYEPFDGDTLLGIYELKDDELRLCFRIYGLPSQKKDPPPRPTEFASPSGSDLMVYVFKRMKKKE